MPVGADRTLLESVIGMGLSAALAANETQAAENKVQAAELVAAKKDRDDEVKKAESLAAQITDLQNQIVALQPPTDVSGVPQVVTMVQAQLALLAAGLLDTVESAIANMQGDQGRAARIQWQSASDVHRNNALVLGMQAALKLTGAQIDALFVDAATR